MVELKPGAKFQSTVCTTQVIVVKGLGEIDLRCGGSPMQPTGAAVDGTPAPGNSGGTLLGKRYSNDDGSIEVLCTKAGDGSLCVGDAPLEVAQAKSLPASD